VAARELGRGGGDVLVLYRSDAMTVDDPAYAATVERSLADLPDGVVEQATTFWSTGAPQLVSDDRRATYAVLTLPVATANAPRTSG
jgi:RND superfamily putative drug exporter